MTLGCIEIGISNRDCGKDCIPLVDTNRQDTANDESQLNQVRNL